MSEIDHIAKEILLKALETKNIVFQGETDAEKQNIQAAKQISIFYHIIHKSLREASVKNYSIPET